MNETEKTEKAKQKPTTLSTGSTNAVSSTVFIIIGALVLGKLFFFALVAL